MRFRNPNLVVSPQEKMIDITKGFGQQNIKHQQGTTRILYDTLELHDNATELRFFKGSQAREFPFSNTGSFGNKLEVGEAMTVTHINLMLIYGAKSLLDFDKIYPLNVESANTLGMFDPNIPKILPSELNILIGNSQVLKPIPIVQFSAEFNKDANQINSAVYTFNTNLVIPPLVEFEFYLRMIGNYTKPEGELVQLRLTIEGNASILSPRQNF